MSDPTDRAGLVAEALRLLDLANAMPVPVFAGGEGYGSGGIEVLRGLTGGSKHLFYPSQDGPGAGHVVEVTVRVMVGPDRSTVVGSPRRGARAAARGPPARGGVGRPGRRRRSHGFRGY